MKAIRFLLAAMFLTTAATAQTYRPTDKAPSVLIVESDYFTEPEIYECDSPEQMNDIIRAKRSRKNRVKITATEQLNENAHIDEFQGTEAPLLVVSQKSNRFAFSVGGFINLRTSYDFDGTVQNIDFVTADIPIPRSYDNRQQFMMDASTSRLFFHGVANSAAVGPVDVYVDMDFRGGTGYNDSGVTNSYRPRLRRAYVSLLGFTIGRDYTTFADVTSLPTTVDFQGPNAAAFNYATVLRYSNSFCNDRLGMAIAIEQPNVSGSYGESGEFEQIPQRVPDGIAYLEYKMGENRQHHIRASGVVRDMYAYNATTEENTSLLGWGAQLSGNIMPCKWFNILFSGTYGEGITPYIQDLIGSGLDFTPNPEKTTSLQTMPMYAWQAAACFYVTKRLSMSGGYSTVSVEKKNGYYSTDEYKRCDYIFGNIFYDITPRFKIACEYLYGSRTNMNIADNRANRVNLMGQFSF